MKAFTLDEMRNIFEIGCIIRGMVDDYEIEVTDGQDAFYYALELAIQFEKVYPDTENYHEDLQRFVYDKLLDKFGFVDE
jgi:hypothetical protein